MNVIDDALNFDPSKMQLITTYEGLNVYYDGRSYYCKGVIKLEDNVGMHSNIFNGWF